MKYHSEVGGLRSVWLVAALALCFVSVYARVASAATLTAAETVANVAAVSEVKASRTLTVGSLPVTTETITIGTCLVTFATTTAGAPAEDANCTGGATILTTTGTSQDIARTAAQIAAALRTLTNVSDTGHGALTVGGSGSTASFTTTGTEAASTAVTFTDGTVGNITSTASTSGVVPVTAVAQVVTFTPNVQKGTVFTISINGTSYSYTFESGTLSTVVSRLASLVDADNAVNCTDGGSLITCTAVSAGTSFTYSAGVADAPSANTPTQSGRNRNFYYPLPVASRPSPADNSEAIIALKSQLTSLISQLIVLLQQEISKIHQ